MTDQAKPEHATNGLANGHTNGGFGIPFRHSGLSILAKVPHQWAPGPLTSGSTCLASGICDAPSAGACGCREVVCLEAALPADSACVTPWIVLPTVNRIWRTCACSMLPLRLPASPQRSSCAAGRAAMQASLHEGALGYDSSMPVACFHSAQRQPARPGHRWQLSCSVLFLSLPHTQNRCTVVMQACLHA